MIPIITVLQEINGKNSKNLCRHHWWMDQSVFQTWFQQRSVQYSIANSINPNRQLIQFTVSTVNRASCQTSKVFPNCIILDEMHQATVYLIRTAAAWSMDMKSPFFHRQIMAANDMDRIIRIFHQHLVKFLKIRIYSWMVATHFGRTHFSQT